MRLRRPYLTGRGRNHARTLLRLAILLILPAATGLVPSLPRAEPPGRVATLDVPYGPPGGDGSPLARMDLYRLPDGPPKRFLVFVHGGSWVGGDKKNLRTRAGGMIRWFLERNFVVAAPNFRLASRPGEPRKVTWREQATDIARALAWLDAHRRNYGVGRDGMLLVGYSSGAHLVALVSSDPRYLREVGLSLEDILGVVCLDVHAYDIPFALRRMEGSVVERNLPLIRHLFGNTRAEQQEASPAFHVSRAPLPPRLVVSVGGRSSTRGTVGFLTSRASRHYVEVLRSFGQRATWQHFEDETHASLVLDFGTNGDGPTRAVEQFLESLGTRRSGERDRPAGQQPPR